MPTAESEIPWGLGQRESVIEMLTAFWPDHRELKPWRFPDGFVQDNRRIATR